LRPNDVDTLDSRGLAYLKLGAFDKAIADYNAALRFNPKFASSLYGRGIAKVKSGESANGNTDIEAAQAIKANIADDFAKYGVK
jgi:tetratricopeptide (TPR) repeat protein